MSAGQVYAYGARSLTLTQWAREYGIPRRVLALRIETGWTLVTALMTPVRR